MKSIIYIGDTHGVIQMSNVLQKLNVKNFNLIHVGDFGLGFTSKENDLKTLTVLNNELGKKNCILYVIRGNHDDPAAWVDIHGEYNYSNIRLVKDFEVLSIDGIVHLFIGGAVSVDRSQRKPGLTWWPGEVLDIKSCNVFNCDQNIDCVVSHNAPDFCHPQSFGSFVEQFFPFDPSLAGELKFERLTLTNLYNRFVQANKIPKYWFYGHFHNYSSFNHNGTTFRLLNVNEYYEQLYEIDENKFQYGH